MTEYHFLQMGERSVLVGHVAKLVTQVNEQLVGRYSYLGNIKTV